MKTRLGKLLADTLRYYYFDRYLFLKFYLYSKKSDYCKDMVQLKRSDNLVVEAAGGEDAANQLLEMDKAGFRESEVISIIFFCLSLCPKS